MTTAVKSALTRAGACAVGIAEAKPVDDEAMATFDRWLAEGHEAGMAYMHNHREIRRDARLLLEGAATVISMAFGYRTGRVRDPEMPHISAYALLPDYHDAIRKLIRESGIGEMLGEEHRNWRVCIDSAPVMERYWAVRSGIGIRGDNGSIIIPGHGCEVFLAEIVTTKRLRTDTPLPTDCGHCGACRAACPTGALDAEGTSDCRICISYLTIEHRGGWETPAQIAAMSTDAGKKTLFGCDRCVTACPHNRPDIHAKGMPRPSDAILTLTAGDILTLPPDRLSAKLKGSCLKRARTDGLRRNALNLGSL